MSNQSNFLNNLVNSLLLAAGVALAGYFISQTLYNSKVALNTADVKGLAERKVEADRAYWSIKYTVSGQKKSEIPALYEKSELDQQKIISMLLDSGFDKNEVVPGVINYIREDFRDEIKNS